MPTEKPEFSLFGRFKRMKVPSRKVLYALAAVLVLLILATAPQAFVDVYNNTMHGGAGKDAALWKGLQAFLAICLLWVLQIGMLTFVGCLVIPDMIALCKGIKRAVLGIPSAWRSTKTWLSQSAQSARSKAASARSGLAALPDKMRRAAARVRALTAAEWFAFMAAAGALFIYAALLYFGWNTAAAVQNWLPEWLRFSQDFMGLLIIDMFLSTFVFIWVMPIWTLFCKGLMRLFVKR